MKKKKTTYGLDSSSLIVGKVDFTADVLNIEWSRGCMIGGQFSGRLPTWAVSSGLPNVISKRKCPKQ